MLSLPNDGRYPALELAPQQRRQKTTEALIRQIEAIARRTPVLMIFEDAHWISASTSGRVSRLSVIALTCGRPTQGAANSGRKVTSSRTCRASILSTSRPNTSKLEGSAQKQGNAYAIVTFNNLKSFTALFGGDPLAASAHLDRGIALYNPADHRPLTTRFGENQCDVALSFRAIALWLLGYPDRARADVDRAVKDGREIGQAATLFFTLYYKIWIETWCGDYASANLHADELVTLARERRAAPWELFGSVEQGWLHGLAGAPAEAIRMLSAGLAGLRSIGVTFRVPADLTSLAEAHAELGQFEEATRSIREAMSEIESKGSRMFEAEAMRVAGEIARKSPEPDAAEAEAWFERSLAVARKQQAKSLELRATMSLARLRRDQGRRAEAHALLAPVYGWFTEGFDTRDLKQAKALLDKLA